MAKDDPLVDAADIPAALSLMTRLPLPAQDGPPAPAARAAWAWPLAGAVVAVIAGCVGGLALVMGTGPWIAAGLALAAQVMLTGALHEDGLADTADGLWGGHEAARRLEIMKDSRIGSYGVIALVLSLLVRAAALAALFAQGWVFAPMIAAAVLSRAPMAAIMAYVPNARGAGLSASVGAPRPEAAALGAGVALAIALVFLGFWPVLAASFWTALAAIAVAGIAKIKIGGQTGDILGAAQQVCEVAALAALCAML